ncbi:MAG: hypothetical protein QOD77_589 [Thermoplasmata archaeon]|nr:hypothetical protein [Thermoplasmata archaeon]
MGDLLCIDAVPTPDLCDDGDDEWKQVYTATHEMTGVVAMAPGLPGHGDAPTSRLEPGEFSYHVEIWKCTDRDAANEVAYYGYKWGYVGTSTAWSYQDSHCFCTVLLYQSLEEADVGYVPSQLWADTAPSYDTLTASLTFGKLQASGHAHWEAIPSNAPIIWKGEFDGLGPGLVPVHAEMYGVPF